MSWVVALHKHGRWGEIVNGTRATITEVDREAVTITVRTDAGAELGRWAPALGGGVWRRSTASWWPRTRISSSLAVSPWAIRRGAGWSGRASGRRASTAPRWPPSHQRRRHTTALWLSEPQFRGHVGVCAPYALPICRALPGGLANEASGHRGRTSPSGSACDRRRHAGARLVLVGLALRVPVASATGGHSRSTTVGSMRP